MKELVESLKLPVWGGLVLVATGAGAVLLWPVQVSASFLVLSVGLNVGLVIARRRV